MKKNEEAKKNKQNVKSNETIQIMESTITNIVSLSTFGCCVVVIVHEQWKERILTNNFLINSGIKSNK